MNRIQYPLSVTVVWHPKFEKGKDIAESLYTLFCRDIKQPLSRGLGIPVYFRSTRLIPVDYSVTKRHAIVLLIDENYFIDDKFRDYTAALQAQVNGSTRIFPVALFDKAYEIGQGLGSLQFIRAFVGSLNDESNLVKSMGIIHTELLHDTARLLLGLPGVEKVDDVDDIPLPIKLFISHAKVDGANIATNFKAFIDSKTKLNVFFDTVDIADGYAFEKQIEENIKESALVVFLTDEYSAREWCRIEVLIAKKYGCSIVVVHNLRKGERRAFPYLGNVPTITMIGENEESFREVLDLTLTQVINHRNQAELLESFRVFFSFGDTTFVTITCSPELLHYVNTEMRRSVEGNRTVLLYPEPPLGVEELRVLQEIDKKILFLTPMYLPTIL